MGIKELMSLIVENKNDIENILMAVMVILLVLIFVINIAERIMKSRRSEPGRISKEWELVNMRGYSEYTGDSRMVLTGNNSFRGYENKIEGRESNELTYFNSDEYNTFDDNNNLIVDKQDSCGHNKDMFRLDEIHNTNWTMEEATNACTPFEHGGYEMNQGNYFNDDFYTCPANDNFDDFSDPDPFGF
jgi:hypothetical protein